MLGDFLECIWEILMYEESDEKLFTEICSLYMRFRANTGGRAAAAIMVAIFVAIKYFKNASADVSIEE